MRFLCSEAVRIAFDILKYELFDVLSCEIYFDLVTSSIFKCTTFLWWTCKLKRFESAKIRDFHDLFFFWVNFVLIANQLTIFQKCKIHRFQLLHQIQWNRWDRNSSYSHFLRSYWSCKIDHHANTHLIDQLIFIRRWKIK